MYLEEYKRWLEADLEDADLNPGLSLIHIQMCIRDRIAGVRSTRESGREKEKPAKEKLGLILKKEGKTHEYSKSS